MRNFMWKRWKIMSEVHFPTKIWLFTQKEAFPTREVDRA